MLGAFDGMGGAGSAKVGIDGLEVSGAYAASRLVRQVVERAFWSGRSGSMDADALSESISEEFAMRRPVDQDGDSAGVIRGSMIKVLPTTAAVVVAEEASQGRWMVDVMWAGDSRVYAITQTDGLQQLTRDDVEDPDPMTQIRSDQGLKNLISASGAFRLNSARLELVEPFVLLAATDGLFHYLPTPGSLEYLVLQSLQECRDSEDAMAKTLGFKATQVARDDVSFALAAAGVPSLSLLRFMFRKRFDELVGRGYGELLSDTLDDHRRLEEAERIWAIER
ncbi:MAG: hypothetical protein FGM52_12310, partial [Mycobacterium sp.]|nr:hypothetical protein [Mycobacterium sp.]